MSSNGSRTGTGAVSEAGSGADSGARVASENNKESSED